MSELGGGYRNETSETGRHRPLDAPYPRPIDLSPPYRQQTPPPPPAIDYSAVNEPVLGDGWPPAPATAEEQVAQARASLGRGDAWALNGLVVDQRDKAVDLSIEAIAAGRNPGLVAAAMADADSLARQGGEAIVADRYAARHAAALVKAGHGDLALPSVQVALKSPDPAVRTDGVATTTMIIDAAVGTPNAAASFAGVEQMMSSTGIARDDRLAIDKRLTAVRVQQAEALAGRHLQAADLAHESRDPAVALHLDAALSEHAGAAIPVIDRATRTAGRDGHNQEMDAVVRRALGTADGNGQHVEADRAALRYGVALTSSRAPQAAHRFLERGLASPDPDVARGAAIAVADLVTAYERNPNAVGNLNDLSAIVAASPAKVDTPALTARVDGARNEARGAAERANPRAAEAKRPQQTPQAHTAQASPRQHTYAPGGLQGPG